MRRDLVAALVVAVAAVAPRLWILTSVSAGGLVADMLDYYDRARFIVEHGRLYPDAFRVPAFPVALAGSFATFGTGLDTARALQCGILGASAVATFALARGAVSRSRAVIAGLIVAWYPGLLLYTLYVMAEPLFMLLVLLSLLFARYASARGALLIAGVFAGLATLTRQAGVAVAAALCVWAAWRPGASWSWPPGRSRRAGLTLAVVVGVAAAMAPWAIRNYQTFGRFMPLETTSGITFLMAHYEGATGRYLLSDWETVHQRYLNREHEEFSRNQTAYRLGFRYIARDPVRIAKLVPARLGYLFDVEGREHLWLYGASYMGAQPGQVVRTFGYAIVLSFPLLVAAAVIALAFGPSLASVTEALVVWVLLVMVVQLITVYGDPRFHLPLVPLLAVLAVRPWTGSGQRSRARAVAGLLVLTVAIAWWSTRIPAQFRLVDRAAAPGGWQSKIPY